MGFQWNYYKLTVRGALTMRKKENIWINRAKAKRYNFSWIARIENKNCSSSVGWWKINWIRLHKRIYHIEHSRSHVRWLPNGVGARRVVWSMGVCVWVCKRDRDVQFNSGWDNWILRKLLLVTVSSTDIVHCACKRLNPLHSARGGHTCQTCMQCTFRARLTGHFRRKR